MAVTGLLTTLVTLLALIVYLWTGLNVGRARGKYSVMAPAIIGPDEFNRVFRVQQNTLEQLVLFIPSLWLAHFAINALWVPAVGAVWIIGRILYAVLYVRDPAKRGAGFMLTFLSTIVLLLTALLSTLKALLF
jgi:glutathione S-transferase